MISPDEEDEDQDQWQTVVTKVQRKKERVEELSLKALISEINDESAFLDMTPLQRHAATKRLVMPGWGHASWKIEESESITEAEAEDTAYESEPTFESISDSIFQSEPTFESISESIFDSLFESKSEDTTYEYEYAPWKMEIFLSSTSLISEIPAGLITTTLISEPPPGLTLPLPVPSPLSLPLPLVPNAPGLALPLDPKPSIEQDQQDHESNTSDAVVSGSTRAMNAKETEAGAERSANVDRGKDSNSLILVVEDKHKHEGKDKFKEGDRDGESKSTEKYKVSRITKLQRVMDAFEKWKSKKYRFYYMGSLLAGKETPMTLGMMDNYNRLIEAHRTCDGDECAGAEDASHSLSLPLSEDKNLYSLPLSYKAAVCASVSVSVSESKAMSHQPTTKTFHPEISEAAPGTLHTAIEIEMHDKRTVKDMKSEGTIGEELSLPLGDETVTVDGTTRTTAKETEVLAAKLTPLERHALKKRSIVSPQAPPTASASASASASSGTSSYSLWLDDVAPSSSISLGSGGPAEPPNLSLPSPSLPAPMLLPLPLPSPSPSLSLPLPLPLPSPSPTPSLHLPLHSFPLSLSSPSFPSPPLLLPSPSPFSPLPSPSLPLPSPPLSLPLPSPPLPLPLPSSSPSLTLPLPLPLPPPSLHWPSISPSPSLSVPKPAPSKWTNSSKAYLYL